MLNLDPGMAARRIPLEKPPSKADEAKLLREQQRVKERLGAHLKRLRTEANLSLRQMAMKINVSPTYLSETESLLDGGNGYEAFLAGRRSPSEASPCASASSGSTGQRPSSRPDLRTPRRRAQ
jgi:hypothetical protein